MKNVEDIPDITKLAANVSLSAKMIEVKSEIPNITNLATTFAFTIVENEIPNVSDLVKKAYYDAKISDIE